MRAESVICPGCRKEWRLTSVAMVRAAKGRAWRCPECSIIAQARDNRAPQTGLDEGKRSLAHPENADSSHPYSKGG